MPYYQDGPKGCARAQQADGLIDVTRSVRGHVEARRGAARKMADSDGKAERDLCEEQATGVQAQERNRPETVGPGVTPPVARSKKK